MSGDVTFVWLEDLVAPFGWFARFRGWLAVFRARRLPGCRGSRMPPR